MSAATAAAAAPPAKGKKKLILIVAVALLVVAGGGGAAMFMMKKKAAEAAEADGEDGAPAAHAAVQHDPKAVPTFVPLDPFTVNLADRDAERYAQVGITLEIADAHLEGQIKSYMPSIRNNILMAIADRTAADLAGRDGKSKLAQAVLRETSRALGYEIEDEEAEEDPGAAAKTNKKKKKSKRGPAVLPIKAVHFSNFIIQ